MLTVAWLPMGTGPTRSLDLDAELLMARFAPVLHFDANETLFPSDVEQFVSHCRLMRWENREVEVQRNATVLAMSSLGQNASLCYLDNALGTLDDGGIERWYRSHADQIGHTVYCRMASGGGQHIIQYWMFYGFNNGTFNRHEGDWELFQVVLDAHLLPSEAMFSQHESGSRALWDMVKQTVNGSPEVYVTRGSHGLSPLPGAVDASGSSMVLGPSDYRLVELTNSTTDQPVQSWLAFGGRWGEWGGGFGDLLGRRGPQGPMFRSNGAMWAGVQWGSSLPLMGPQAAGSMMAASTATAFMIPLQARDIASDGHAGNVGGACHERLF